MFRKNRHIMRAAWSLSRAGVSRFGGRPAQYIREAMRMVWADYLSATSERRSAIETRSSVVATPKTKESRMKTISRLGLVVMFATIPVATFGAVAGSAPVMVVAAASFVAAFCSAMLAESAARPNPFRKIGARTRYR